METLQNIAAIVTLMMGLGFGIGIALMLHPKTRSRLLEWVGWSGLAANSLLVVSPLDVIPDIMVGLGQIDDMFYIAAAFGCYWLANRQRQKRLETSQPSTPPASGQANLSA